jgi:hypothetical protein
MKRLLIANLIIGTFISVQANAATQIDNAPHGNPLALFSTKDMGGNVKRATYGVKWKDGTMTYTNIELVCGENKARDIGYSDDGKGEVWKDRSKDTYNGKTHYDLVGKGNEGSLQYNVYRAVCKDTNTKPAIVAATNNLPYPNEVFQTVIRSVGDKCDRVTEVFYSGSANSEKMYSVACTGGKSYMVKDGRNGSKVVACSVMAAVGAPCFTKL